MCSMIFFLAATSPNCTVSPESATGSEQVTFTCAVTVCGNSSIRVNITRDGTSQATDMNTVTWQTTADSVVDTDVMCSADFGVVEKCPSLALTTTTFTTTTSECTMTFLHVCVVETLSFFQ